MKIGQVMYNQQTGQSGSQDQNQNQNQQQQGDQKSDDKKEWFSFIYASTQTLSLSCHLFYLYHRSIIFL